MANFEFKVHRVTALPTILDPYSVYYVAPASTPNYVEIYVSNAAGTTAKRVINESDIKTLISEELSKVSSLVIFNTIAERNAATPTTNKFAYVINATADSTVKVGGASYLYNTGNSTWTKISESESLDVSLTWAGIVGKPNSSVSAIDLAVTNSHTHSNKQILDKVGEDSNGSLMYNNKIVTTQWTTTNW